MKKGKKLESKLHSWLKDLGIYHQRFFDSASQGMIGSARPADYWVYIYPQLFFIECKETQAKSLGFSAIRPTQYKASLEAEKHNIKYLLLISINNSLYAVKMGLIMAYIGSTKRKSMSLDWLQQNGSLLRNKQDLAILLTNLA